MEQANPKRQTLFDCTSIKSLEIVENRETESRVVVPRAWGKERVESLFTRERIPVLQDEKSCGIVWPW